MIVQIYRESLMKKIILGILLALLFVGCSSKGEESVAVEPKLVVGKELSFTLNDQFEKQHKLNPSTKKLIFAFSKDSAHICNDFFNTKEASYLEDHNTQFIADVSAAPSLIRSLFIMPGLKDFKHTVLLLDTKELAATFRADMETDKIVVVSIIDEKIVEIKSISTVEEVKKALEND
jgi:thioredoxin-related protein